MMPKQLQTDRLRDNGYAPTPDEIDAACKEIQSRWTDTERRRRATFAVTPPRWTVPIVHVDLGGEEVSRWVD